MVDQHYQIFDRFLPSGSTKYCYDLWVRLGFEFKIKRGRKTKLGDYRYDPRLRKHIISINNDLNPYAFLITYLHEVAHLLTYQKYTNRVAPHGKEWKMAFKQIAAPMLHDEILPIPIINAFGNYLRNPKASSCSDPKLLKALQQYDANPGVFLCDLAVGSFFIFHGRLFQSLQKKRTRYICLEKLSQKKYLISGNANVEHYVEK